MREFPLNPHFATVIFISFETYFPPLSVRKAVNFTFGCVSNNATYVLNNPKNSLLFLIGIWYRYDIPTVGANESDKVLAFVI
jgi:hypothetical protein